MKQTLVLVVVSVRCSLRSVGVSAVTHVRVLNFSGTENFVKAGAAGVRRSALKVLELDLLAVGGRQLGVGIRHACSKQLRH